MNTGYRCEKDTYGRGAGRIPDKGGCPGGTRDDGTSCWDDHVNCSGGGCRESRWDSCQSRSPDWLGGGCIGGFCCGGCDPIKCSGGIVKTLFQRQSCGPNEELQNGLCYPKCREGYYGDGPLCWSAAGPLDREVYSRGAGNPLKCAAGKSDIAGLCYGEVPQGYQRQTLGFLAQECPPGTLDLGVACARAFYGRDAGLIPLDIVIKERK